jgi:HEAT repeat protein
MAAITVLSLASCTAPEKRSPDVLIQEFTGHVEPLRRSSGGLRQAYGIAIDALIPGMAAESVPDREQPQQTFQTMCLRASGPGANRERAALSRAIAHRLGADTPLEARAWMLRQLERIGGGEVVDVLADLLEDDHPRIRDGARRALQHNPDGDAGEAILDALTGARDAGWRVALIHALAARREREAVESLSRYAGDDHPSVVVAAIAALGDIANDDAVDALFESLGDGGFIIETSDALLRAAQRVAKDGRPRRAKTILANVFQLDLPTHLRIGALEGFAALGGEHGLTELLRAVRGDADPAVRLAAARILERFPDRRVTTALVDELLIADPADPVLIIETLGRRGDRAALPTIIALTDVQNGDFRLAALRALEHLGDESVVLLLAWTATQTTGEEREAARSALDHLTGDPIDAFVIRALEDYDEMPRVELIRAVRTRRITRAIPLVFEHTLHADEAVRLASLEALAALAPADMLSSIVLHLLGPLGDAEREAAENAVVELCGRIDDQAARLRPIIEATPTTDSPVRVSMIRILGRVRGEGALPLIRAAAESTDEDVRDAAVRALADWNDLEVADDLNGLIADSENETHKVLALRGYIRLVRETAGTTPAEQLEALDRVAEHVDRVEDKRLMLSALGEVHDQGALARVEPYIAVEELRREAIIAAIKIARLIGGLHRGEALAALDRLASLDIGAQAAEQAEEAREFIERYAGYITDWQYAGPYFVEGMKLDDLFAHPFPPEPRDLDRANAAAQGNTAQPSDAPRPDVADAGTVEWQPLPITNDAEPWRLDLAESIGGDHRCIYVRTVIDSPDRREVHIEIGSDDGVRVWLRGDLIHTNDTHRGVKIAEDIVPATLTPGPNTLILKITNGTGGWGFACGIKGIQNVE